MTSALGLKLQEAIERAEARKAMANWIEPTTTPTPMTTTTTLSVTETTFNAVRDNPGLTRHEIGKMLEPQGCKYQSSTSLISVMLGYGLLLEEDGKLRAIGNVYRSRTDFNPRLRQKPKDRKVTEKKEVRMIRRPAPVDVPDPVNNPSHYKVGGIETIDFIKAKLTPEEFKGYLLGNVLKYASRAGHKDNATQDAGKLAWYANRLAEVK